MSSSTLGKKVSKNEMKLKQYTEGLMSELRKNMEDTQREVRLVI